MSKDSTTKSDENGVHASNGSVNKQDELDIQPVMSHSHCSDDDDMPAVLRSAPFPRVSESGKSLFDANGNCAISAEEREEMLLQAENKFAELFDILRIDRNDPNAYDTPRRLARMWVTELFRGRFQPPPVNTVFPNRKRVNELIITKGIQVMSVCSHHWQPISGVCHIGYIPGDSILGLSKFTRIVDWIARRGQIQEELGEQVADYLEKLLKPRALGVVISARHYCMIARGVSGDEDKSITVTSVMRGMLLRNLNLRNEFLKLISQ